MRKEFLTPPGIPSGVTCRTLKMPSSKEFLGIFNSALLNMLEAWRYEQVNDTDLTVEETVAKVREILNEFWLTSECDVCYQPTGQPFIRLGEFGEYQMLGNDGWGVPTGDYAIPPVTPREGGTDEDKRCLAAANATRTLELLYENVSDSYAGAATEAEALINLLLALATLIAGAISLAAAAIIAIAGIVFRIIYDTVAVVGADYWTSDFNEILQCALFECSVVDGAGVVTFDFSCFNDKLARKIDVFTNPYWVALYGQIQYFMTIIGVDGLNLAGATTSITTADCSACTESWCFEMDFALSSYGWTLNPTNPYGTWVSGQGWTGTAGLGGKVLFIDLAFDMTLITQVEAVWQVVSNPNNNGSCALGGSTIFGWSGQNNGEFSDGWVGESNADAVTWGQGNGEGGGGGGDFYLKRMTFRGEGVCPFGEPNCDG